MQANEFAKEMRKIASQVEASSNDAARRAALAALTNVVLATPVDTGRARVNWQIGIGSPKRKEIPVPAGGVKKRVQNGATAAKGGGGGGQAASAAISSGKAALGPVAGFKGAVTIYLSNNLPYINRLNNGWSKQAPSGFVQKAVAAAVAAVKGTKLF